MHTAVLSSACCGGRQWLAAGKGPHCESRPRSDAGKGWPTMCAVAVMLCSATSVSVKVGSLDCAQ